MELHFKQRKVKRAFPGPRAVTMNFPIWKKGVLAFTVLYLAVDFRTGSLLSPGLPDILACLIISLLWFAVFVEFKNSRSGQHRTVLTDEKLQYSIATVLLLPDFLQKMFPGSPLASILSMLFSITAILLIGGMVWKSFGKKKK